MPPTALLERDLGAREDDGELGSDDGERIGDPPLRDPASGVDAGAEAAPERAAHRETEHRRIDEGLDDVTPLHASLNRTRVVQRGAMQPNP